MQIDAANRVFFYQLRTQYENLGDLIINRECLRLMRMNGRLVVNVRNVPSSFVDELKLHRAELCHSSYEFGVRLLISAMRNHPSYLVLVPGGLSDPAEGRQRLADYVIICIYHILKAAGVRIIRLGASFGPFSPSRESIERMKSAAMATIGLRDTISINYARRIGVKTVSPFPDFAFLLPCMGKPLPGNPDDPYAVVSFRAENHKDSHDLLKAARIMLAGIDPERKLRVVFSAQVERDETLCHWLAAEMGAERRSAVVSASVGEPALFDLYRSAAVVLSNRLHVLLFALSCGTAIWALVNEVRNKKIIGLFQDVGLGNRLVDINALNASCTMPLDTGIDWEIFPRMAGALRKTFTGMLQTLER